MANAQVGIGTTSPEGELDVVSTQHGVVFPRLALISRNVAPPVSNPQGGLLSLGTLVYNTTISGPSPYQVTPGYYFWDGTEWVALGGNGGRDWSLLGNSGTSPAINFLGTRDNTNLIFRTHAELDLINQQAVEDFFAKEKPEYVILAAAFIGVTL